MSGEGRVDRIRRIYVSRQFAKFVVVGGVALGANWIARIVFNQWVGYNAAIVLAYGVGIATAYLLNREFVFPGSKQARHSEVMYFVAVNVGAFPFVWLIAYFLGDALLPRFMDVGLARALGHGLAITTPVFVNFALHKFVTFRER